MKSNIKKEKLTDKGYWDKNWQKTSNQKSNFARNIFGGISNYEFYDILNKYISKKDKSIFEVGCAPGNYLISINKKFNLAVNGIEYSKEGVIQIKNNFKQNNVSGNIICGDFFDNDFLKKNKEKYDIVYSLGFIEHFEDSKNVISRHFDLVKKGGTVIITIPNLNGINKLLVPKEILDLHNLKIMNIEVLNKLFSNYEILELKPTGGFFNFGLFTYKNWFLEKLRLGLFIIQRVIFDPIFILLYKLGINFSNKYTSPQFIIICRKK